MQTFVFIGINGFRLLSLGSEQNHWNSQLTIPNFKIFQKYVLQYFHSNNILNYTCSNFFFHMNISGLIAQTFLQFIISPRARDFTVGNSLFGVSPWCHLKQWKWHLKPVKISKFHTWSPDIMCKYRKSLFLKAHGCNTWCPLSI